jgi:hypothetical protein
MALKGAYKVKVTIGDAVVEVEGEERGVVAIVKALSNVVRSDLKTSGPPSAMTTFEPADRSGQIDIRSFFQEKKPSSDVEASAVAAYYYKYLASKEDRKDVIDSSSLQEAFRLAARPLPRKTAFTLVNARNAGYLDSTGDTGLYRLNPVGFNLVEHTLGKGEIAPSKKVPRKRKTGERKGRKKGSKR